MQVSVKQMIFVNKYNDIYKGRNEHRDKKYQTDMW